KPIDSSPVGYFSYYGKKLDPEPGRCRRTDGKKWRCSKDAHPDSKYCERHMHRSRNRSRKHVESKSGVSPQQSQSHLSSSSTSASHVALGSSGNFENIAMQSAMAAAGASNSQHYGMNGKDY
ncbi:growth-regulating factor 5-like, partial [Phalaenopsis equestris]|uniref:growth-regulating factor 5-like n=1 Tax=Phalaenopsis equestris TaxID=78828 RepID=UPI0009E5AA18